MLVRSATVADILAVLPMVAKICALHEEWDAAKYGFLPNPAQRYERWLKAQVKNERSVFLVVESEAAEIAQPTKLVGFLIATTEQEIPIYRLQEFGFIHDLWVEPEYRRTGIARQMITLAVERFDQMGVKQIRLDTSVPNEAARQLFKSCGFRASMVEMLIELERR